MTGLDYKAHHGFCFQLTCSDHLVIFYFLNDIVILLIDKNICTNLPYIKLMLMFIVCADWKFTDFSLDVLSL